MAQSKSEEHSETNSQSESPLQLELCKRLAQRVPVAFLSITINNLRPFIDAYGWDRGEQVLQMLARVIHESIAEQGKADDDVFPIGDWLFAVISSPDRAEMLAQAIIRRFDAAIAQYYDGDIGKQGYIDLIDRRGNPIRAPVAGVVIGIVTNEKRELIHPLQVEQVAAEIREHLRILPGSRMAFDRRQK